MHFYESLSWKICLNVIWLELSFIFFAGIYGDIAGLKQLLRSKHGDATEFDTKELYESVIDSDVGMVVRLVIVFGGLTMSLVRKNFDGGLGASLKKLTGGRTDEELLTLYVDVCIRDQVT